MSRSGAPAAQRKKQATKRNQDLKDFLSTNQHTIPLTIIMDAFRDGSHDEARFLLEAYNLQNERWQGLAIHPDEHFANGMNQALGRKPLAPSDAM